jgi:hypothetical protein
MGMDLNLDTLQSLAVGASGGIPLSLLLLNSMKSLRESFDAFKGQLDNVSSRLQKLEVVFELTYQSEVKSLQSRIEKLEKFIFEKDR